MRNLQFSIETGRETDGRCIAEIPNLPGAYGLRKDQRASWKESMRYRCESDRYVTRK
jgi:hypothetical protein